jgi:methyl-accepting chemotaxis protein
MTIAKRLMLLLGLLLGALILVGTTAVVQMRSQTASVTWIKVNIVPSLDVIGRVSTNFAVLRANVLRHIISDNEKDMAKMEGDIKAMRESIDGDLKMYLKDLITDDKDRELVLAEQARIAEYYTLLEATVALSRNHQPGPAGEKILASRATVDAVTQALKTHWDYNLKLVNDAVAAAEADARQGTWIISIAALVAIVAGLLLGFTTYRHVTGSLTDMQTAMGEVSANLDFTRRLSITNKDEIADTGRAFNALLEKVQTSLQKMRASAEQVSTSSTQLSTAAQQVSTGSGEQSEAASSMAAAVEELTVSINHVSDRASEANTLVVNAGKVARDGAATIGQTLADIRHIETAVKDAAQIVSRLDEGSTKVNAVVAVIKEVADQTNLLALNAAIEAARAGEQGRGFAVVADEVRKLAERTAQSTQEIASTMLAMQTDADNAVKGMFAAVEQVENGVVHAQEAENAVREIESGSKQTVVMVGEITEAIREQSTASSIIAQQVERIAQMSEENNAAAQNTADTSSQLSSVAGSMRAEVGLYRV